ncbi:flagellar M-ring protein FliF [Keratinibaculum paraultunense]|nr:flagellar basal-body MS-ring/collar protein FliF [Keratinibaculum paraultunense]QQY80740.1 flagellar M-ring protein FliF [Keratinibaculum paraultunense]
MRNQLNEYWQEMDKNKRKKIIIISVIVVLTVVILTIILSRPKYEVLYEDLSLKDMAQITKKLDEMGVKWKTPSKDDTTTILVPADMKNKIKIELASYGLPKEGYGFMDAFKESSWTMTDYDKKERMKYALQNELSSTISEIDGIENATVYIDIKEDTGFVLEEAELETTASVFIERSDNRPLKAETIAAIKNLVAGSVNMDPDNVKIIDSEGKLLTDEQEEDFLLTDQFVIKNNLESKINDSLKAFLENVFGPGNVDIRSSVKINFDSEKTSVVEFAPPIEGSDEGLIRSMEQIEEHMVGGTAAGRPGQDSNESYPMPEDGNEKYDKISNTINYELNEINKEIRKAPGQVEDITVAVLINKNAIVDGEFTPALEEEIVDLIYAATGLDTKQVQVVAQNFRTTDLDEEKDKKSINWLAIILSIAAASAGVAYGIYRRQKRQEEEKEIGSEIDEETLIESEVQDLEFETEESKMKAQIEKLVENKPEIVAQLIRTWLNE